MLFTRFLPWLMWSLATLFFAYQFIMRLAPGLVMAELMQKYNVDASAYGLFAAMYYFSYAGMQIPVALLLDRFGPRLVISVCALTCSVGTLLLVYTDHWGLALLSRFLIGTGSAGGFLGASKVIDSWFSEKSYTKMVGLTFTFGLLGAVYGGKPVGLLISQFGWVDVLMLVGFVGLAIAALIALVVKDPLPSNQDLCKKEKSTILSDLKTIVGNKHLLLVALANFLMVGALEGFADVWGVPYLVAARGLLKEDAAQIVSSIFVGMLFGGPILAYCADKLRSNYWITSLSGFCMGLIFLTMLSLNGNLQVNTLYVLLFATGIFCCYQVLVFSIGVSLVPKNLTSLTVAFLNCINMLGGSFFHNVIGQCLDFFWTGAMNNGVRVYDNYSYTWALSSIAIAATLGAVLIFVISPKRKAVILKEVDNTLTANGENLR